MTMSSYQASPKVLTTHRHRLAVVYVRQSTATQVERNTESTDRQYALCCATPSRAATSLFGSPSAQPSTILDRNANACDDFRLRGHLSSCPRSSEDNSSNAFGRPIRGIAQFHYLLRVSTARHNSR